jgi:hypothetical protein
MKKLAHFIRQFFFSKLYAKAEVQAEAILELSWLQIKNEVIRQMPDSLIQYGHKVYSLGEEDGMIQEIVTRLQSENRTFIEIGSGNGLENNTHFLLLNQWKGAWIDASEKKISQASSFLGGMKFDRLLLKNAFVTIENVIEIYQEVLSYYKVTNIDFLSLDIDGNDYYILEAILQNGYRPRLLCLEYNAKYIFPSAVKVSYQPEFYWKRDDYMGVSLGAWQQLLTPMNYTLIACDIMGTNCFYIRNEDTHQFTVYTPAQLFQPCRYFMAQRKSGHRPTLQFLKDQLRSR